MKELSKGDLFAERYRILGELGRGAMGVVYRAAQLDGEGRALRDVALKVMLVADAASARRFVREARVAARLKGPNALAFYDAGRDDAGRIYFAMERVEGTTLADVIGREAPLDPRRIRRLATQICDALTEAHRQESPIIHRDLKPANIFITRDEEGQERVKVGDFGVAKTLGDESMMLTAVGFSPGTPRYMAPEQWSGDPVDPRTDLYALGVMLYEMAVAKAPFGTRRGGKPIGDQHREDPPPPLPEGLSPRLCKVIERLLAKNPADRFPDADSVVRALGGARRPERAGGSMVIPEEIRRAAMAAAPASPAIEAPTPAVIEPPAAPQPLPSPAKDTKTPARWAMPALMGTVATLALAWWMGGGGATAPRPSTPSSPPGPAIAGPGVALRTDLPPPTIAAPPTPEVESVDPLRLRAEAGDADAALRLSARYGGEERRSWLLRAAEGGSVEGQARLAFLLEDSDPESALRWYRRAAAAAHAGAQLRLGLMLDAGNGAPRDEAGALALYREAAEGGSPDAQLLWARALEAGEGVPRDLRAAEHWYEQALRGGAFEAADRLAALRARRAPTPRPAAARRPTTRPASPALARYGPAARAGDAAAQRELGLAYALGQGVGRDAERAAQWLRKSATAGDAKGQIGYGDLLDSGVGVRRDRVEALEWWRRAADAGVPEAQRRVADAYAKGRGAARDLGAARQWWQRAAEAGDAQSARRLAESLRAGAPREAVRWFGEAAERGDPLARHALGEMFAAGEGVPRSTAMAADWFRQAADDGHAASQRELGLLYARGEGVARNEKKARRWLRAAARGGDREASAHPLSR